jgi:putative DNA primase/helicase
MRVDVAGQPRTVEERVWGLTKGSDVSIDHTEQEDTREKFYRHLFGGQRGLLALFSGVRMPDGDVDKPSTRYFDYPASIGVALAHATKESDAGREVWHCAHLLTGKRRIKENAAPVVTLWGDLDGAEIPNGPLLPTGIVGSSPGRFHCYWRLSEEIPPELAEDLNKRLATVVGADPSGFDLTQLLRVPGTINYKYPDRPVVKILGLDGGRSYTPREMDEALPKIEKSQEPRSRDTSASPPVVLAESALRVWRGEDPKLKENGEPDRSSTLVKIGRVLYDAGATRATMIAALVERDEALGFRKYTDRPDAHAHYHKIMDELESNGRNTKMRLESTSTNPASYMRTDLGNAERFVDAYRDRVRWCPARKSWLIYDGPRYVWDERGESVKLAHHTARAIFHEAAHAKDEDEQKAIAKWAFTSQGESRINAMLSQSKPYLAVGMDELDRDPWLVNCQNGTLDLRTGRLRDHDPEDLITRLAPVAYDPEATCPRFERFLHETLVDAEVVRFVKRYAGYTLTGITRERIMAILYGSGKNGKTTLVELLHEALGDYARNTDVETLLIKKYQGVGNDVAALKGARFVSAAEVEKGRRLAESKIKQLTGRDTVTARFLFGENFDFKPEFKLWLSTNNKPVIQGTDDAIWDRLRLIPFTQRFDGAKADPLLSDKLRDELAGVFAWMVEGCLEWQEHGLGEPESVTEATKQYREDMDTLAAFFEDRCVIGERLMTPASRLYKTYQLWCDEAGEHAETQKMFGMRLSERGFVSEKFTRGPHKDRKGWLGIGLRADDPEPEDPDDGDNTELFEASGAGDGPLSAHTADDHPLGKKDVFAGKPPDRIPTADGRGPLNQQLSYDTPRVRKGSGKRSASSASSAGVSSEGPVTAEQETRIRGLVRQGFSEWSARCEVLAKEHEIGCECEVCS